MSEFETAAQRWETEASGWKRALPTAPRQPFETPNSQLRRETERLAECCDSDSMATVVVHAAAEGLAHQLERSPNRATNEQLDAVESVRQGIGLARERYAREAGERRQARRIAEEIIKLRGDVLGKLLVALRPFFEAVEGDYEEEGLKRHGARDLLRFLDSVDVA